MAGWLTDEFTFTVGDAFTVAIRGYGDNEPPFTEQQVRDAVAAFAGKVGASTMTESYTAYDGTTYRATIPLGAT